MSTMDSPGGPPRDGGGQGAYPPASDIVGAGPQPGPSATDLVGTTRARARGGASAAEAYAEAIFSVAQAEGALDRVGDELYRVARTVEGEPELLDVLSDPALDVARKLEIIDGLLSGRAHPQTVSALMYVVQAGKVRQVVAIADALAQRVAEMRAHAVAEARTAVPLTDEQQHQLADAIGRATGKRVDLKVIVDPDVVGGVVVRVGDTVIDGSVARRLSELRARLVGA